MRSAPSRAARGWLVLEVLIAVFAVLIGGTGVFLVTQGSKSTAVDPNDFLDEFTALTSTTGPAADQTAASTADISQPDAPASEASGAAAEPTDLTTPGAAASAPSATPPTGAAPGDPDPNPGPEATPAATPAATPTPAATSEPAPVPTFSLPPQGLYTYATTGYESISIAGGRHDYQPESYLGVRHLGGCAWESDHRIVQEHRERKTWCTSGPELMETKFESWITFFGQEEYSYGTCDPPQAVADLRDQVGQVRDLGECTGDRFTSHGTGTFLGREMLTIGGVEVETLHYKQDTEVSGETTGEAHQDIWYHAGFGLPVKIVRTNQTHANAFGGDVTYTEDATFELVSMTPQT